jgi:hypothetical protein
MGAFYLPSQFGAALGQACQDVIGHGGSVAEAEIFDQLS